MLSSYTMVTCCVTPLWWLSSVCRARGTRVAQGAGLPASCAAEAGLPAFGAEAGLPAFRLRSGAASAASRPIAAPLRARAASASSDRCPRRVMPPRTKPCWASLPCLGGIGFHRLCALAPKRATDRLLVHPCPLCSMYKPRLRYGFQHPSWDRASVLELRPTGTKISQVSTGSFPVCANT